MANELASALQASRTEPAAFGRVYAATGAGVLAFFARRTFDVHVAAELTAETFAVAYEHRERFRGSTDGEAAGWLYGIAHHQLGRYARRGTVERRAVRRLGIQVPRVAEEDYDRIVELAGLTDMRERVAAAFESLPRAHHDALRLRVIDERSYADVAASLGVSEQTARARVSRALRRLADAAELASPTEVTP